MYVQCHLPPLLLLLLVKSHFASSLVYHIAPSSQCPEESCVTLNQLASSASIHPESNLTLVLLPGHHSLNQTISISYQNELQVYTSDGHSVEITCTESANLYLHNINRVQISGVKLTGCKGSRFESISQVFIENLTFTGHRSSGAALELTQIGLASISSSRFVSNTAGTDQNSIELFERLKSDDLNYDNIDSYARVGGALLVTSSNVYIAECLFKANSAQVGGAIYSRNASNVTIAYSNFTQNHAVHHDADTPTPGGVMVADSGCVVSIHNSSFWNNTDSGVIVLESAKALVRKTTFAENSCKGYGGVLAMYESTLEVENSTFYKNRAQIVGGAIHAVEFSNVSIYESVFDRNEAAYGGVINIKTHSKVNLRNSVFTSNEAIQLGGVTSMQAESSLTIDNSTLESNTAKYGGVLFGKGCTIVINGSTFDSNSAGLDGGFSYITHSDLKAFNSNFANNRAAGEGGVFKVFNTSTLLHNCTCSINQALYEGVMRADDSNVTIQSSAFTDNTASSEGGVATTFNCVTKMYDSVFSNNRAGEAVGGAMIINQGISTLVENCSFVNNYAVTGGALVNHKSNATMILQSTFFNNTAEFNGALTIYYDSHVFMNECIFLDNVARTQGGAIMLYMFSSLIAHNNTYIGNIVSTHGGALYMDKKSQFIATDDEFIGNRADHGGAISMLNSDSFLTNCTFGQNQAVDDGGALNLFNASHIIIRSSTFVSNSVPSLSSFRESTKCSGDTSCYSRGGVLMATISSTIDIDNSTFINNSAEYGGTIGNSIQTYVVIHDCLFFNNRGYVAGAVLYSEGFLNGNITSSMFLSNRAGESGGAFSLYTLDKVNIDSSTFADNSASTVGGVIYGHLSTEVTINNSMFIGNSVGNMTHPTLANPQEGSSTITECLYQSNHYGGVIFVNYIPLSISNSTFVNNSGDYGGVVRAICNATVTLKNTTCNFNWAAKKGGVLHANKLSRITLEGSTFNNNSANEGGGVISCNDKVTVTINDSTLENNLAEIGATIQSIDSNITINQSTFHNNRAPVGMLSLFKSMSVITETVFTRNSGAQNGGTAVIDHGELFVQKSTFADNFAYLGGVIYAVNASVFINHTSFEDNHAILDGGVMYLLFKNNITIYNNTFDRNSAGNDGGVIFSLLQNKVDVIYGRFSNNYAENEGAVFIMSYQSVLNLRTSDEATSSHNEDSVCKDSECDSDLIIENNKAAQGAVLFSNDFSTIYLKGQGLIKIRHNSANLGVLYIYESTLYSNATVVFEHNVESIYAESSTMVFVGYTSFINCSSSRKINHLQQDRQGGVVKSVRSEISFDGQTTFKGNTAESGAAIHATESNVHISGETEIAQNRVDLKGGGVCLIRSRAFFRGRSIFARNLAQFGAAVYLEESTLDILDESTVATNTAQDGGGFYLQTSTLNLNGNVTVVGNVAEVSGGGLLAIKSTIIGERTTQFTDNEARQGGACRLDGNTKLYQRFIELDKQSKPRFSFTTNSADSGGALFIADNTNIDLCANNPSDQNSSAECFFYTSTPSNNASSVQSFVFSDNTARLSGADLFGGLLDRCTVTPLTYFDHHTESSVPEGLATFQAISRTSESDLRALSVGSYPVRVCLCVDGFPNCIHNPPLIEIQSGETFSLQLAAVDQASHVINATIHSMVHSQVGGLGDGQAIQITHETCTELTFSVYSQRESEQLDIHAEGPCIDEGISQLTVRVKIQPCFCPIGFQISTDHGDDCVCVCDSVLAAYVTDCDHLTESVIRSGNYWLSYVNASAVSGYLVYPNCPLDYCHLPTVSIKVNLNNPAGSDAQCTSNKAGLLCGACQEGLSLSLGSSRCLLCPGYWPVIMIVIFIAAFLAGLGLVVAMLVLNLTVAVGTINALIFYANIVEAYKSTFFPSSTVSFASVIISWLNLELGFDVCLFEGMDKYTKTWLQLAFPTYVIFLVGVIIFTSQHSTRFSQLVGKRNPVATLATLILLSYAKILQTVITVLSFATLEYPDGSRKTVWLPDATVRYFYGKHSALFLLAITILFVGILFTALLFFWQWILRLPDVKFLRLVRHHKLQLFMETYNAPYNQEYRYWTGLLLLVRVVLYFIAAVNVSGDPRVTYLTLLFILSGLMTGKWALKTNLNKAWHNDFLEGITHVNLLIFTAFSWYTFETGKNHWIAAHISVAVTLILIVVIIMYHVRTNTNIIASIRNMKNYKILWKKHYFAKADDKVESEIGESHEHLRRTSTFSVVEVPRFESPRTSIDSILEESEGLANIEFHEQDVEISGSCYINPLHTEAFTKTMETTAFSEQATILTNKQADLILDELTR